MRIRYWRSNVCSSDLDVDLVRPVVHVREREPDRGLATAAVTGRRTVVRADLPAVQVRPREDPGDRIGRVGDAQMEFLARTELDAIARRIRLELGTPYTG